MSKTPQHNIYAGSICS